MDNKLNLDAYYYSFQTTGAQPVDEVLSAVACAGKAFHNTSDWNDEEFDGITPAAKIQIAATLAAVEFRKLKGEVEALKGENSALTKEVDQFRACAEPFLRARPMTINERSSVAAFVESYYRDGETPKPTSDLPSTSSDSATPNIL